MTISPHQPQPLGIEIFVLAATGDGYRYVRNSIIAIANHLRDHAHVGLTALEPVSTSEDPLSGHSKHIIVSPNAPFAVSHWFSAAAWALIEVQVASRIVQQAQERHLRIKISRDVPWIPARDAERGNIVNSMMNA